MKVLHISKFYPPEPGGIENFVYDLAGAQAKKGHEVCVLAHQAEFNQPTRWERINGVNVGRVRSFGQLAYAPVTPEFPLYLLSLLSRFKPDVVHAQLPNISAFWLIFIKKTAPIVLQWQSDIVSSMIDPKMAFLYKFYKPWETMLLKKADRIICASNSYLQSSTALRRFKDKSVAIPLGMHPDRLSAPKIYPEKKRKGSGFTVLSVGRFAYYKGFEYLVQAAEKVPYANFIIVGDGPRYPAIKKLVEQKGLKSRVSLLGTIGKNELRTLFAECDVFCLPSIERTEAFGIVLLEAMSFYKPLVTTTIQGSGVNEVNKDGHSGLAVLPENPDALAEAIEFFRQNPGTRKQMGKQAHNRFETYFHIGSVADQIDELYKHIIYR